MKSPTKPRVLRQAVAIAPDFMARISTRAGRKSYDLRFTGSLKKVGGVIYAKVRIANTSMWTEVIEEYLNVNKQQEEQDRLSQVSAQATTASKVKRIKSKAARRFVRRG